MSELIFIRHAETDLAGTFCGHSDPPINARGQVQVNDLIVRLGSEPFDAIYSSDLHRAVDTATALSQAFAVPCTTTTNLREIHFGDWEGLTWAKIEGRDADFARRWVESFPALPAPNGEIFETFERRVLSEIDRIFHLATSKRIAVVTHSGVMRIVLCNLLGYAAQDAWELTQSYCSVFVCAGEDACQKVSQ